MGHNYKTLFPLGRNWSEVGYRSYALSLFSPARHFVLLNTAILEFSSQHTETHGATSRVQRTKRSGTASRRVVQRSFELQGHTIKSIINHTQRKSVRYVSFMSFQTPRLPNRPRQWSQYKMCLLAEWPPIAMQLQAFIASALLLSGLASAVNLPRANEAAECQPTGSYCSQLFGPHCCAGHHCSGLTSCVSVAIHSIFMFLLTQLWSIVLRSDSAIGWLLAPARKLSLTNQGQIKFHPVIACSYLVSRSWRSFAFAWWIIMNRYSIPYRV